MILDFLFPHVCVACRQVSGDRKLFCGSCTETVEFLGYDERCGRCFRKKSGSRCRDCAGEMFQRKAAIFESGSPIASLMWDQERFAKTIAAFFVVQLIRLRWPFPEAIYFPKGLKEVGRKVGKFLSLPRFSGQSSVLCLSTKYDEDEIPTELYFAKLFFMGLTIND